MRLAVYGATSALLGAGVIISAFNQRANFYSACVHLAQSNACLMVLTNLLLLLSILFGHALQLLFYGPLRTPEIENLYEKAWYAVTETCLAMTIFRDEFDVRFIVMFGVLLFIKCFCWIGGSRVEFMETSPPENPALFHVRLASSLVLLLAACAAMLWHSVASVLETGRPNMMVMFAFEFAILLITAMGITGRYVLSLVEKYVLKREAMRRTAAREAEREAARRIYRDREAEVERRRAQGDIVEDVPELEEEDDDDDEVDVGGWEEKGTWVFYLELVTDLLKLLTYLSFFSIVLRYYGLPLHIIRDVYLTLRSFITRIRDFIRYRRATAHMNSRYPDATPEEVEREGVCIICREEMRAWTEGGAAGEGGRAAGTQDQRSRPKKLPCGHVLHFACLRSWLERQQRCPTCRRPVLDEPLGATGGAQGGNAQGAQAGVAAGGAGVAFGAQLGPLGFDIGVGGPGFVQGLIERMNQQQRPGQQGQQQQGQQGQQQGQQQQPGQAAQMPQMQQGQDTTAARQGGVAADIEQHIVRTRNLLDRELAMLEITQRQLRQLQELQIQAQATANGALPTQPTPTTTIPPARMSIYHGGPALQGTNASAVLPPGMVLPPGWNVVPLTAPGAAQPTATTAAATPTSGETLLALRSAEALNRRRAQQAYRERMSNYHTRLTPAVERSNPFARPGLNRATTAPAIPTRSTLTTSRLSPVVQRSVNAIRAAAQTSLEAGDNQTVYSVLAALPSEYRREVLQGLAGQEIVATTEPNGRAAEIIAGWIEALPREERGRVVLGLPEEFREGVVARLHQEERAEVGRLEGALRGLDNATEEEGVAGMIESISDWTQISLLGETSTREEVERAERETRELVNRRVRVLNDISRVMRTAAGELQAVSSTLAPVPATVERSGDERVPEGFNTADRLSLFGSRSIFAESAQEEALSALQRERELVEREREWRRRREEAVGGLLGKGKGKEVKEEVEEEVEVVLGEGSGEGGKGKGRSVTVEEGEE